VAIVDPIEDVVIPGHAGIQWASLVNFAYPLDLRFRGDDGMRACCVRRKVIAASDG